MQIFGLSLVFLHALINLDPLPRIIVWPFFVSCLLVVLTCLFLFLGISCPQGWRAFDDYCYLASSQVLTWSQARDFCIEKGGELVKITSERENDFVLALARQRASSVKEIWIGLRRNAGGFYWTDNSFSKYTNWAPKEPNNDQEQCVHMWTGHSDDLPYKASGTWNDLFCSGAANFQLGLVCKLLP